VTKRLSDIPNCSSILFITLRLCALQPGTREVQDPTAHRPPPIAVLFVPSQLLVLPASCFTVVCLAYSSMEACSSETSVCLQRSTRSYISEGATRRFPLCSSLKPSDRVPHQHSKSEAISVTARGGLEGYGMLLIPHSLDSRLTDGGKAPNVAVLPRNINHLLPVLISA
jgi:hypothetical protein